MNGGVRRKGGRAKRVETVGRLQSVAERPAKHAFSHDHCHFFAQVMEDGQFDPVYSTHSVIKNTSVRSSQVGANPTADLGVRPLNWGSGVRRRAQRNWAPCRTIDLL